MRHRDYRGAPEAQPATADALPAVVLGYLNRLRRLPLGAWAEAARSLEQAERAASAAPIAAVSVPSARATLRRIVSSTPWLAAQTQRRVQNMVEIAQSCGLAADAASMRRAALGAALALAVRPALGEELFACLYQPFETLIPVDDLVESGLPGVEGWWVKSTEPALAVHAV